MEARSTQQVKYSAMEINDNVNKTMAEFTSLNKSCVEGPALSNAQMHSIKGRVRHCLVSGLPLPSWAVAYNDIKKHTHTVCVPYYKAAPYNISHTKIFQWRFSL